MHFGTLLKPGENINFTTDNDGTTFVNAEAGQSLPAGGTTGQVLAKASDEDYDVQWNDAVQIPEALMAMLNWENIKASLTTGVEVWTGAMAGEDKVYGRLLSIVGLPNNSTSDYPTGISNIKEMIAVSGRFFTPETVVGCLPHASPTVGLNILLNYQVSINSIRITTGADRRTSNAIVEMTYTCTDR